MPKLRLSLRFSVNTSSQVSRSLENSGGSHVSAKGVIADNVIKGCLYDAYKTGGTIQVVDSLAVAGNYRSDWVCRWPCLSVALCRQSVVLLSASVFRYSPARRCWGKSPSDRRSHDPYCCDPFSFDCWRDRRKNGACVVLGSHSRYPQ